MTIKRERMYRFMFQYYRACLVISSYNLYNRELQSQTLCILFQSIYFRLYAMGFVFCSCWKHQEYISCVHILMTKHTNVYIFLHCKYVMIMFVMKIACFAVIINNNADHNISLTEKKKLSTELRCWLPNSSQSGTD